MNPISLEQLHDNLAHGTYDEYADYDHPDFQLACTVYNRTANAILQNAETWLGTIYLPRLTGWPTDSGYIALYDLIEKIESQPTGKMLALILHTELVSINKKTDGIKESARIESQKRLEQFVVDCTAVAGLSNYPELAATLIHLALANGAPRHKVPDIIIAAAQAIRPHLVASKED